MTASAVLQKSTHYSPGRVAAKAVFNAGRALGLSQRELSRVIGVSEPTVSRMRDGGFELSGTPLELSLCLVRVFRSLDAITGSEAEPLKAWIAAPNTDLVGVPKELILKPAGLVDVMNYLDAARAPT